MSDELSIPRNPVYRVPRRRGLDPLTRRLMLIACGLSGALVLIVAGWSSVGHHGGGQVPVVQADQRPVRVKPANPGGMQIPGLSAETGTADASASADKLAPGPETPDPQALARQTPPPAPALSQAPAARAVPAQTAARAAPTQTAAARPSPVAVSARPEIGDARPTLMAAAPPPAAAKPAPLAAAGDHRAPVGGTQVQLAALTTEVAARQQWDRLVHRMPGVFGAHHPMISRIEHDGHTLWRLRTGDFATEAEASQFCQLVRAKGGGCAVAAF